MLFKHVIIYENGLQIDKFDCAACDFTDQQLLFHGIVSKHTGKCDHNKTFRHIGNTYIEIDRAKRECIVIPEETDIQMIVTW